MCNGQTKRGVDRHGYIRRFPSIGVSTVFSGTAIPAHGISRSERHNIDKVTPIPLASINTLFACFQNAKDCEEKRNKLPKRQMLET